MEFEIKRKKEGQKRENTQNYLNSFLAFATLFFALSTTFSFFSQQMQQEVNELITLQDINFLRYTVAQNEINVEYIKCLKQNITLENCSNLDNSIEKLNPIAINLSSNTERYIYLINEKKYWKESLGLLSTILTIAGIVYLIVYLIEMKFFRKRLE